MGIIEFSLAFVFTWILAGIALEDALTMEIPHYFSGALIVVGLARAIYLGQFAASLLGGLAGLIIPLALLYFRGNWEDMGGGDIWLLTGVGIIFGPAGLGAVTLLTAGLLLIHSRLTKRNMKAAPYPLGVPLSAVSLVFIWLNTL